VIGFESLDGALERIGCAGDLREFLGGQLIDVFVERIAWIDAVHYAIDVRGIDHEIRSA